MKYKAEPNSPTVCAKLMPRGYKAYPNYKGSGVEWLGDIPESWVGRKLKYLARIKGGRDQKQVIDDSGMYPVYGSGGVFGNATEFLYSGESVLLGRKGTVDRPLYVSGKFWTVDTMYFTEIEKSVFPKWFFYSCLTIHFDYYQYGSAVPSMTQEDLHNIKFSTPSLMGQKSIANYLDKATAKIDTLIEKQTKLIALLKEKRQAVISSAVTRGLDASVPMKDSGVEWFKEIPEHWRSGRLKQVSRRTIVGLAEAATHAYAENGVPILRATNIRKGKVIGKLLYLSEEFANSGERLTKKIKINDLITVRTGNAGVTAIATEKFDGAHCFTMLITTLKENELSGFYEYFLGSSAAESYFSLEGWGTAQVNISVPILQNLPTPVIPKEDQLKIVSYLDEITNKIDNLITKSTQAINLLKEKRTALISACVTGKIDVRDAA